MLWSEIEKSFYRAGALAFSRKKMVVAFPVLVLCGVLIVFCRAVAFDASDWVALSLTFLPVLLSAGLLLPLGVVLIRIHQCESKHHTLHLKQLCIDSLELILGTAYLALPSVLLYLMLWIVLGVFFLLKELGDFFGVLFAFAPFILIFAALLLCLFNLGVLFFVAPVTALQPAQRGSLVRKVLSLIGQRPLTTLALFLLSLVPAAILVGLLSMAALLTDVRFTVAENSLSVALEWFFIMVPFCALLTPAVTFFFNFAAESHQLLRPHETASP